MSQASPSLVQDSTGKLISNCSDMKTVQAVSPLPQCVMFGVSYKHMLTSSSNVTSSDCLLTVPGLCALRSLSTWLTLLEQHREMTLSNRRSLKHVWLLLCSLKYCQATNLVTTRAKDTEKQYRLHFLQAVSTYHCTFL